MSVCPVPFTATKTDYTSPGSFTSTPPDSRFEFCIGGSTSTTAPGDPIIIENCCVIPGPPGPAGELILLDNGVSLGVIKTLDITGSGIKASITGDAGTLTGNAMVWRGDWLDDVEYKTNDVIRNNIYDSVDVKHEGFGNAYVCISDHTSSLGGNTPPDIVYWAPATDIVSGAGLSPEDKSFFDSLKDSVFDWIKDAYANGDWLKLLAAGVGVAVAGALIVDMLTGDGSGDGQADSRFDGTPGYNGAFTQPYLPVVVTSIMHYAGYTDDQFDVSLLPNTPVHFTVASTMTLRNLLTSMALAYQFDVVPSGATVKFIPKYQAPVRNLTTADLGHKVMDANDVAGLAPYTAVRTQGIDLPRSVTLNYFSSDLDYNVFSQTATLETFEEGQDTKLEVPFAMTDADAKRIAETALVNAHIEQQQYTFTTDYYNIDLEPGDVITIPLETGETAEVRIIQVTSTDDGILEFTVVRSDYNTQTYESSGIPSPTPPDQSTNIPSTIGYSSTLFLETPPINDQDSEPRLLAAVHGYAAPGWPGATVYRSVDSGASYNSVLTSNKTVTMGMADTILPPPVGNNYFIWDDVSTVDVTLKQGTLVSAASDLAVQNGINRAMIGRELIGFRNATLIGPNQYRLSRLMRGRQGSEPNIGEHVTQELFLLIDDQITLMPMAASDIGKPVKFKTVTLGSSLDKASSFDVQPYALNMRPWRVAQPTAVKAGDDWQINWIERPRLVNAMRDYTEIEHDADWAGYAIAVYNGVNVVRTQTTVDPNFTYTAAMQTADFGGVQATLKISIVQMSRLVGGGYPYVLNV